MVGLLKVEGVRKHEDNVLVVLRVRFGDGDGSHESYLLDRVKFGGEWRWMMEQIDEAMHSLNRVTVEV